MMKASSLTVRVKLETKRRLAALARNTRRSESLVIEEALEQYLEVNEWQLITPTLEQRLALFDPVKHGGEAMAEIKN